MVAAKAYWLNNGQGLCAAAHGGPEHKASVEEVTEYLADPETDVNERSEDRSTPLHYACFGTGEDHPKICKALLEAGADFNAKDCAGRTPLHMAAAMGHFDQATSLIEAGADVNICNSYGSTPLHNAALSKQQRLAALLLRRGAHLHQTNNGGWTPLHYALRGGDGQVSNEFVRFLLGVDPLAKEKLQKLPAHPIASDHLEPHPKSLVPAEHSDMI